MLGWLVLAMARTPIESKMGMLFCKVAIAMGAIIGISFFPLGIMVVEMWEYLFDHCSIICDHDHDPVYCSM